MLLEQEVNPVDTQGGERRRGERREERGGRREEIVERQ